MSAGSVSTPTRTTASANEQARARLKQSNASPSSTDGAPAGVSRSVQVEGDKRPGDNDAARPKGAPRITSQWPGIPNASAIAQAVSGRDDLKPTEAASTIMRAMHGDMRLGPSRTIGERRTGSHVGARDAQIGALEQQKADLLRRQGPNGQGLGPGAAGAAQELDRQIRQERGLNAVADVLHTLGATDQVVDIIEDTDRVQVVRDAELAGNAAYDHETGAILVSQSLADRAGALAGMLHTQGLLGEDGTVVAGRIDDIDRSGSVDELIKIGTLLGVHEQLHAEQHADGSLDEMEAELAHKARGHEAQLASGLPFLPEGATLESIEDAFRGTDAAWALEAERVAAEEYDAYLAQEQADLALGATLRVQLVTDVDGNPLPKDQGVANIVALERGRALPHGPDRHWLRPDVVKDLIAGADIPVASVPWSGIHDSVDASTIVGESPGWKRPGWKRPGWKRPGMLVE